MAHILIIEDEERIAAFIAKGLRAEGHQVESCRDGISGLDRVLSNEHDLLVLDIGLPDMDGFEVLDHLRAQGSRIPVIVLTARDSIDDTVTMLDAGADDYMPKPFRFAELSARVRLRLRSVSAAPTKDDVLRVNGVELNHQTRRATVDGREVELSAREWTLLEVLMRHAGQVLSREQLLNRVWGYDFDPGSNVVDVYIGYVRKKVGADRVETVRGMGYSFGR